MTTLICFGLGYCAQHYIAEFGARFARIIATTRTTGESERTMRKIGHQAVEVLPFAGTRASPALLEAAAEAQAWLVSIPPAEEGDPVLAALRDKLGAVPRIGSIVYLSSLAVYGDHQGAWVDEDTPPGPLHARGHARMEAERAWQAFGQQRAVPIAILRLGGIYGPGQNALINLKRGRAKRIVKPGQVFNRIHVLDVAQAIEAAFACRAAGVFNVVDDEPAPPSEPIVFAAGLMGVAPPPAISFAEAQGSMSAFALSFYAENKRARNDRLKRQLGVRLRYPTYREGLRALHAAGEGGNPAA